MEDFTSQHISFHENQRLNLYFGGRYNVGFVHVLLALDRRYLKFFSDASLLFKGQILKVPLNSTFSIYGSGWGFIIYKF